MARRITIVDEGAPQLPAADLVDEASSFDLQDGLWVGGVMCFEVGTAIIWWPAAILLAGVFCFVFAWLKGLENGRAQLKNKNGNS